MAVAPGGAFDSRGERHFQSRSVDPSRQSGNLLDLNRILETSSAKPLAVSQPN